MFGPRAGKGIGPVAFVVYCARSFYHRDDSQRTELAVGGALLAQPLRHWVDRPVRLGTGIETLPGYEGVGW